MENQKIEDTTITINNKRINVSEAGIWMDNLDASGNVESSVGLTWEEFTTNDNAELDDAILEMGKLALAQRLGDEPFRRVG